ncbi:GNAT family N-acetyltransferase [Lentzea sp. BCCO 10_0798]|uniref:GNAT family N-acetyltransferase n=1 Tax=Lentzea kristufekii TaxID=3095430 RepID=A0ABU4TNN2_9PSEU|nr:GNAT family N-acetyltransferase [Lentzea sp. BCCO 10_0798]MDX8049896.1 GNAT family N-acetyltransferase [Lentzea sp. BCCO 10_0798]
MQIRSTTDQDLDVFVRTVHTAFGRFPETPDENGGGLWWSAVEMDRGVVAETGGKLVGTAISYPFELTLPGAVVVPAAGISSVGVLPTHRRHGVLTAMMRYQLGALRDSGEFLSVLLATEGGIYGRFGYGPATCTRRMTVQRGQSAFRTRVRAGAIEVLPRSEATEVLEEVYDRYRRTQPGALSRPHRWWALGAGMPPVAPAPRYVAVHRDAHGVPDGYATYVLDGGTLTIDETIAADDAVFAALARFALDHDLVTEVVFKHVPTDHPLRWMLADFNAGATSGEMDWLWVRLLDVPRALTARGWLTDGEIVLDVDDPFLGEHHRYLLTVEDGKAECVGTTRDPDLSLDVRDLGSIYLGGTAPSTLVRAGHVLAHGSAAKADALFRAERPPHCLHWF